MSFCSSSVDSVLETKNSEAKTKRALPLAASFYTTTVLDLQVPGSQAGLKPPCKRLKEP